MFYCKIYLYNDEEKISKCHLPDVPKTNVQLTNFFFKSHSFLCPFQVQLTRIAFFFFRCFEFWRGFPLSTFNSACEMAGIVNYIYWKRIWQLPLLFWLALISFVLFSCNKSTCVIVDRNDHIQLYFLSSLINCISSWPDIVGGSKNSSYPVSDDYYFSSEALKLLIWKLGIFTW